MKKEIAFITVVILAFPFIASAHNSRVLPGNPGIVEIQKPEISQAFYGELKGGAQLFSLTAEKDFTFYINILAPDIPEARKDFSVEIYRGNQMISALDPYNFEWIKFYEPFGGDHYWRGPETKFQAGAGMYVIKVYNALNPDCHPESSVAPIDTDDPICGSNFGRFALVVGEKESWPPGEIWNTLKTLPTLKKDFFDKSPFTMFFNYIGLGLLILILIVIGVIYLVRRWLKSRKHDQIRDNFSKYE